MKLFALCGASYFTQASLVGFHGCCGYGSLAGKGAVEGIAVFGKKAVDANGVRALNPGFGLAFLE